MAEVERVQRQLITLKCLLVERFLRRIESTRREAIRFGAMDAGVQGELL